jgi:hypothetical protein
MQYFIGGIPMSKMEAMMNTANMLEKRSTMILEQAKADGIITPAEEKFAELIRDEAFAAALNNCGSAEAVKELLDKNGVDFIPSSDVTYSIEYDLDTNKYSSFLICDTEMGRYTPFSEASRFSFTVQRSGLFILVGEEIPETQPPETSNNEGETTSNIPASTEPTERSPIILVLVIVSVILTVIIAGLIYTYVFKQYY